MAINTTSAQAGPGGLLRRIGRRTFVEATMARGPRTAATASQRVSTTRELFATERDRVAAIIFLDAQSQVIRHQELARDWTEMALLSAKVILQRALSEPAAASFFVARCRPYGNATPTAAERRVAQIVRATSWVMEVPMRDHIIVGANGTFHAASVDDPDGWRT